MTTEADTRPKCFAGVKTPTTNNERFELHMANFVHVIGLPCASTPPLQFWGAVTTYPNPFTTILVTEGGEVWLAARLPGESDKNYSHVVKILAPCGTMHLHELPAPFFRAGDINGQHLLRRLSNPDYDPANPSS